MPRTAPEVVTGPRGPRGPENVSVVDAESLPLVPNVELEPEKAHFVSKYREYSVVCATEPDRVNSSGEIVRGVNKSVRFRDFNLITADPTVIKKLRGLDQYGLGREVWERHQLDKQIAERSMAAAESAIEALPPELQSQMIEKLTARFKTFQLPEVNPPN